MDEGGYVRAQVEKAVNDAIVRHGGDPKAALTTLVKQHHAQQKEIARLRAQVEKQGAEHVN